MTGLYCAFYSFPKTYSGVAGCFKLDHGRFLPHRLQFIDHTTITSDVTQANSKHKCSLNVVHRGRHPSLEYPLPSDEKEFEI
jgi:hypothetical protein